MCTTSSFHVSVYNETMFFAHLNLPVLLVGQIESDTAVHSGRPSSCSYVASLVSYIPPTQISF